MQRLSHFIVFPGVGGEKKKKQDLIILQELVALGCICMAQTAVTVRQLC